MKPIPLTLSVSPSTTVSAEIIEPSSMSAFLVLAHGAGAGMTHDFMVRISSELAQAGIGTMRFNFPFIEQGKKRPDFPAVAEKTIETAINRAHELYPKVSLFAGGKSFGGRMTSHYIAKNNPVFINGVVFFGFPLHAPGKPSTDRADHLIGVKMPMLFLQGTRDSLAQWNLIEEVCSGLTTSTLVKLDQADHSFHVKGKDILPELAGEVMTWMDAMKS